MTSPRAEDSTGMPSSEAEAEAEVAMKATLPELLFPPLVCLACVCLGLLLWVLLVRHKSRKDDLDTHLKVTQSGSLPSLHGNAGQEKANRISPSLHPPQHALFTHTSRFPGDKPPADPTPLTQPPLLDSHDLQVLRHIQGQGPVMGRELASILMPVVFSLGFCPLTLLLHGPIVRCLWPPSSFPAPPNINDAIACFLVPAGMVYAISFGFAFQQVIGTFGDIQVSVQRQADRLHKLLTLVSQLTCVTMATRLAMLRVIKDMTLTLASRTMGGEEQDKCGKSTVQDLEDLLRLLYTAKVKAGGGVKDLDPWQRSVVERLEQLLAEDDVLTSRIVRTRIHGLQWAFLETLGYLTFLGMLLVQCSSYRAELAMCLITVISISLLCYIVADLDSPFYGVFRVCLACLSDVIRRLDDAFHKAADDVMMEKSVSDFDERHEGNEWEKTHRHTKGVLK